MSLAIEQKELFWGDDPSILFQKKKILQFFPDNEMSIEEKINSITRFTIYITIILTLYSNKITYIFTEIILLIIFYLYYYQNYSYKFTKKKVQYPKKKVKANNRINLKYKNLKKTENKGKMSKLYNNIAENSLPNSYYKIQNQNGNETINFAKWLYT